MNKKQVKDVVRVCAPTYDVDKLQNAGIKVRVSMFTSKLGLDF